MEQPTTEFGFLALALVLLASTVISVPIARRIGLSAIVAYLIAGIVIGPFGLAIFRTPGAILSVAELGIVMLLFLIGLELELGQLIAVRAAIALQLLEERGNLQQTYGQRAFAILLFQDMAVVPLLALLPLLGETGEGPH